MADTRTPQSYNYHPAFTPSGGIPTVDADITDFSGSAIPASRIAGTPAATSSNIGGKDAAQVANVLANPMIVGKKPIEDGDINRSWLQRLFDTTDEANGPVESVWDGMLKGLTWTYDRIAQAESYALSAIPGGVDTYSWDQAGQISPGQTAIGNVIYDYNALSGNANRFNILDEKQRKATFEDSLAGKLASGGVDLGLSIFADPFMIGGKAAKMTRLKYLDKLYTPEELDGLGTVLDDAVKAHANGADPLTLHPIVQAVAWATEKTATGAPARSVQEIVSHQVFKQADNIEGVTAAMLAADTVEEGVLAVRYMLGDLTVVKTLSARRADLVDEIQLLHRKKIETQLMSRPQSYMKMVEKYQNRVNSLWDEVAATDARAAANPDDVLAAAVNDAKWDQLYREVENLDLVKNFELPDPAQMSKAEKLSAKTAANNAQKALQQARERDVFFQKALGDEESRISGIYNALANKSKGFSSDTAFGRMAEQSRQSRAGAAMREKTTKRAINVETGKRTRWHKDVYGTPGMSRLINLWRWMGDELPSGRIALHGKPAEGSSRELAAVLNDIAIYSGEAKEITVDVVKKSKRAVRDANGAVMKDANGDTVFEMIEKKSQKIVKIGGAERKEEILRQYVAASGEGAMDVLARKRLIDGLEKSISSDMAAWYKMDPSDMKNVTRKASTERDRLIDTIKNRNYWIDEDGHQNKAPFLEAHLQEGTYLLNFRAIEREIEHHLITGRMKQLKEMKAYGSDRALNVYQMFNEVWRPATLLRLGYTQRNVTEGLIRATAFMFSTHPTRIFQPVIDLGKDAAIGTKNIRVEKIVEREAAKVEAGIASKRFTSWRTAQVKAADTELQRIENTMEFYRTALDDAKAAGDTASMVRTASNMKYMEDMLEGAKHSRIALDDDDISLLLFRQQGKAKMRGYSGDFEGSDALNAPMLREAFNDRNGYAQIAWANMSSDGSRRLEAALAADGITHIFKQKIERLYVNVNPSQGAAYYDGVASALMQYKNSRVGEMILKGENPQDIAIWLRTDKTGREIAEFIGKARPRGGDGYTIISMDDALDYVESITARLHSAVPSQELLDAAKLVQHVDGKMVTKYLEGRDDLVPVVGNFATEVATNSALNTYKGLAHTLFRYLGTLPEDALVRGPFYGQRYNAVMKDMLDKYTLQVGKEGMSIADLQSMQRRAHSAALTDTKKWIYTIERRTNLGQIGEYAFPFISATQNSVTTFGRLIWNDPRIGAALVKMWQAPQKMGWEDENGDLMLPIPHDLIPDGVEQSLGIDNMMNMKISKNGLNVIFPQAGDTPLPSPGPLVTLPASEIMKHGLFGASLDAPDMMKAVFGEKEADQLWTYWKEYLFGQGQGVSSTSGSVDLILPPWIQKATQMVQGELDSPAYAYQYSLQLRTEQAKYLAGYRDEKPTASEIRKRTNGLYVLRMLGNLTAFTPPQYVSKLQPLIDVVKANNAMGIDGARINSEMFGDYLLMLGDFSVSKNVAGAMASTTAYSNARKYSTLLESVSPEVQDNLSVLGIILNNTATGDTSAMYDPSVYAWQFATNIPGIARKFREMQSPAQALVESQKNAGWVAYIKGMDVLDAIRQQRGLKSYRVAGARDLAESKRQLIARLAGDPSFAGWYDDFKNFGSSRTANAIELMTAALNDPQFMKDNGGQSVWQSAKVYIAARNQYVDGRLDQEQWDAVRAQLADSSTAWATLANRYLSSDDEPESVGVSFATMGATNG